MKLELVIDRLSQLGEGVATSEERTVFVDGAFPGERVLAEVEPSGKLFRGRVLSLIAPSPDRRTPPCPLADRCGGCDWMALDERAQREAKREIVFSALEHIGAIGRETVAALPDIVSPAAVGYRRRAVLHFDGAELGYFQRRSHAKIAAPHCPALVGVLAALPGTLSPLLAPLARDCEAVHLLANEDAFSFAVILKKPVSDRHREIVEKAVENSGAKGAVIVPQEGSAVLVGKPWMWSPSPLRPAVPLYTRADAFVQANGALAGRLVQAAVEAAGLKSEDRALELYSGNGAFTFAVAGRCAELWAIESDGTSLELARRSAREGGVHNVRFVQGDALKAARGLLKDGHRFDVLLVDPPRTGARGLASLARDAGVRTVVYVACDAAALARDAADLKRVGFRPVTVQVVDMFPQTRHVEAVLAMDRA